MTDSKSIETPKLLQNGALVTPGDIIGVFDANYVLGSGLHIIQGVIFSSLVGTFTMSEDDTKTTQLSVLPITASPVLPTIGDVVLCTVREVQTKMVYCTIDAIDGKTNQLCTQCRAVIRPQNVRTIDVDGVVMYQAFQPGDIVRGIVISYGDSRSYFISTARDDLGVIYIGGDQHSSLKATEQRKMAVISQQTEDNEDEQQ